MVLKLQDCPKREVGKRELPSDTTGVRLPDFVRSCMHFLPLESQLACNVSEQGIGTVGMRWSHCRPCRPRNVFSKASEGQPVK